jgi:hypothetical protein
MENEIKEYIKWLENKIEVCLEDKDLQREHWAFCQSLKKYRELALQQPPIMVRSEQLSCSNCGRPMKEHSKGSKLC